MPNDEIAAIRARVEQETMSRWYADGAEASLRRLWDRLAAAEAGAAEVRRALEAIREMCQSLIDETDIIDLDWIVQCAATALASADGS